MPGGLQECFPYMARRLLSDDDPRVRKALKDVLYGGRNRLDIDRYDQTQCVGLPSLECFAASLQGLSLPATRLACEPACA